MKFSPGCRCNYRDDQECRLFANIAIYSMVSVKEKTWVDHPTRFRSVAIGPDPPIPFRLNPTTTRLDSTRLGNIFCNGAAASCRHTSRLVVRVDIGCSSIVDEQITSYTVFIKNKQDQNLAVLEAMFPASSLIGSPSISRDNSIDLWDDVSVTVSALPTLDALSDSVKPGSGD